MKSAKPEIVKDDSKQPNFRGFFHNKFHNILDFYDNKDNSLSEKFLINSQIHKKTRKIQE